MNVYGSLKFLLIVVYVETISCLLTDVKESATLIAGKLKLGAKCVEVMVFLSL